ncbi:sulfatase-like hydrolase/transferase [Helicobacter zhangjianzhongii]|uniref:sulfatase-like hydrolase/transferase n=1 Tax=Helicobacter zhangjianzhongii TaxID=2974574 RepID=UPI0025539812|nr:sulfatase-like hydrolase/transferase [Helicobacter sp. CPD2-1]MDL0079694.1 sulfatase-like hydrolase/transferase [Helicobacter sp. CPD2-1]
MGGLVQVAGTGWTMAGTIAHLCGIPLTMPIGGNSFSNKYFLDSALCVSDVLANHGYTQAYLSGLDSSFAGMKYFLQSHAISVLDLPYFQQTGAIPSPLPQELQGFWGLKDSRLFALARDMLPTLKEPFALYVSTIDTHHLDGFVDPHACASVRSDYQGSFTCTDMLIAEFIDYAQSLYGDSVSIVVVGDHLSMKTGFFPPNVSRYVFDLFINPKFTAPYTLESTKSRTLSHFDIAPLLLDSVGIRTEAFGLGRNPLYKPTLLESTFSQEELNALIAQKSRMYDSFWDIGQKSYNLIKPKLEPSPINQTQKPRRDNDKTP